jgi:Spy/CpxP family protein refolding chaperone
MKLKIFFLLPSFLVCGLLLIAISANADAPLKSVLDLSPDQAAQVAKIQKEARDSIRPVRGELHRQERVLRRARIKNDSDTVAEQEKRVEPLRMKLKALHESESKQIRTILTPEQNVKYDKYLQKRAGMVGSSRDVKEYK